MHQFSTVCLTFILITVLSTNIEAKRGCSNYGHSCFGGHGKRSEIPSSDSMEAPIPIVKFLQQQPKRDIIMDPSANFKGDVSAYTDDGFTETRYTVYELLKQWMIDLEKVREAQKIEQQQHQIQQLQQDGDYMKTIDNRN